MGDKIKIIKEKFILKKKEFVTPHLIRVYLENNDVSLFENTSLGGTCKLLFPPLGIRDIHYAEFDEDSKKWISPSDKFKPVSRTYTLRGIDAENNQIIIDFANHGVNGPGSRWANEAIVGDRIGVSMKLKKKDLVSKTDFVLLGADLTGLPVISTIIETLPAHVKGIVCVEVPTENDMHTIASKADLEFKWIVNPNVGKGSALFDLIKKQKFPKRKEGKRFAYIAGESKSVKESKSFFKDDLEWKKDEFYCTSHWKAGKSEKNALEDCHSKIEEESLIKII